MSAPIIKNGWRMLCVFILLIFAGTVNAGDKPSNIGFIEEPPNELKEKFPMCDAFLKVEWIDKEGKIGYSHYEAKLSYGKELIGTEKKIVWALVNLDDTYPSYALDIYQYQQQGKIAELINLVRNGKRERISGLFVINYREENITFYESFFPVLSDFRETVCIAYPDEQRAWIVEGKSVEHAFIESEKNILKAKLVESSLPKLYSDDYARQHRFKEPTGAIEQKWFDSLWVLDINFDGKPDLLFNWPTRNSIIYSVDSQYFQMAVKDIKGKYGKWDFPPQHKSCELFSWEYARFITTDGKHYFFGNRCNLTELTSGSMVPSRLMTPATANSAPAGNEVSANR